MSETLAERAGRKLPEQPDVDLAAGLYMQGKFEESNAILKPWVEKGGASNRANFCYGRNLLELGFAEAAETWFDEALRGPRPFVWAHYEKSRLRMADNNLAKAAEEAALFLEKYRPTFGMIRRRHRLHLLELAHKRYAQDEKAGLSLYSALEARDITDPTLLARRAALRRNAVSLEDGHDVLAAQPERQAPAARQPGPRAPVAEAAEAEASAAAASAAEALEAGVRAAEAAPAASAPPSPAARQATPARPASPKASEAAAPDAKLKRAEPVGPAPAAKPAAVAEPALAAKPKPAAAEKPVQAARPKPAAAEKPSPAAPAAPIEELPEPALPTTTDAEILQQRAILQSSSEPIGACVRAAHRLIGLRDMAGVDALFPRLWARREHFSKGVKEVGFRLFTQAREFERLDSVLGTEPGRFAEIGGPFLGDTLFKLVKFGDDPHSPAFRVAREIALELEARPPKLKVEIDGLLHFVLLDRDWDRADRILSSVSDPDIRASSSFANKRLQILCGRGDLDGALHFYIDHLRGRKLQVWEAFLALRMLCECKRYDLAAELLGRILRDGEPVPQDEYLILRICRKSGEHEAILRAMQTRRETVGIEGLEAVRQLMIDDVCVGRGVRNFDLDGIGCTVSERNALLVKPLQSRVASPERIAAFLCTDRKYFFSAVTFLTSFAVHHHTLADEGWRIDWRVFIGRDVPLHWGQALVDTAAKLGLPIEVVEESAFLASDVQHKDSFGVFTGGATLSRAAYFRIYAAQLLLGMGIYDRGCYFDTDVICQGNLRPYFKSPFDGALLLAKVDEGNEAIAESCRRNDIPTDQYFNSGIMQFNFRDDRLGEQLARAVWLAENEPERLVIYEQCALNVAFLGLRRDFAPQYNTFLRPNVEFGGEIGTGVLLHFLEHPKPWDTAFEGQYRPIWSQYAQIVRNLMEPAVFREIAAAGNDITV